MRLFSRAGVFHRTLPPQPSQPVCPLRRKQGRCVLEGGVFTLRFESANVIAYSDNKLFPAKLLGVRDYGRIFG